MATPAGSHRGWWFDKDNGRLYQVYNGVKVAYTTAAGLTHLFALGVTGGITATTGNLVALVGNAKLGAPAVFATTQGQGIVHMGGSSLSGVAPVGATVTSGAIFASDTVIMKIIANGNANNVET